MARISLALVLAIVLMASPAGAQTAATDADIQILRDLLFEAGTDLARLRTGDYLLRGELRAELGALRVLVSDFAVRVDRGAPPTRSDYSSVRHRIEDVRRRARGERTVTAAGLGPGAVAPNIGNLGNVIEVPATTEIEVRLLSRLDSGTAKIEDRIEATTFMDLMLDGQVVVPAGSLVRGVVTDVGATDPPGRPGTITVRFDLLTVGYGTHPIRATVIQPRRREGRGTLDTVMMKDGAITSVRNGRRVELQPGAVLSVRLESTVWIPQ